MDEEQINTDGSVLDPIEELAEILCRLFECEDMIRLYRRAHLSADNREKAFFAKRNTQEWYRNLDNEHADLQDLFPESNLSVNLDETGTYL